MIWILIAVVDVAGWLFAWRLWRAARSGGAGAHAFAGEAVRFAILGCVLSAVAVLLGFGAMRSKFAAMRLLGEGLSTVVAPCLLLRGVLLWRSPRRGASIAAPVLLLAGVATLLLWSWARFVEPYRLEITRHVVASSRLGALDRPIKVVVVADLQTDAIGAWEREVFAAIDAERADLILLPGDFLQVRDLTVFAELRAGLHRLLAGLEHEPRLGIFGVEGDIDVIPGALNGSTARTLDDEIVRLPGVPLQIAGLSCATSRRPLGTDVQAAIDAFDGYTIVFGHAPEFMLPAIDGHSRPEALLLAGHTHGGQVVIPGFGPPITLSSVPHAIAAGGMHELGRTRVCVSRGIGMERGNAPRVRLFCRPELVVIELGPPDVPANGAGESR